MFTIRRFAVALLAACTFASQSQAGYLGNNFLVTNEQNTLSDVSYSNATPGSLAIGSVVFGYQSLGQVNNNDNGLVNLPTGAAWVVFSFKVDSIVPSGSNVFVNFVPTPAADPHSLQSLVPNLVTQAGLSATASSQLIALEVNSTPDGFNQEGGASGPTSGRIRSQASMTNAMGYFNNPAHGGFATEFAFGLVPTNNDFLTIYAPIGSLNGSNGATEAGGATMLYNNDGYTTLAQLPNTNPDDGLFISTTNQVTVAGTVYGQPGNGAAPQAQTGAAATDHATYSFDPNPSAVPEPSSIILFSVATPLLVGMMRRRRRGRQAA